MRSVVRIYLGPPFSSQKDEGRRQSPGALTSTFCPLTSDVRTGAVAQLGEHLLCKQRVVGSIPISSTNYRRESKIASINGECNSGLRSASISAIERSLTIEYGL